jgi:ATP-dependent DNA helicase DinG
MYIPTTPENLRVFQKEIFTKLLPKHGFAVREQQIELADEIFAAIINKSVLLAEAAVGAGKTLAYLLAAVLARRGHVNEARHDMPLPLAPPPVVVATSSIALQSAVANDYIPSLSAILLEAGIIKSPLTSALRKGKRNFICDRRLKSFYASSDRPSKLAAERILSGETADLSAFEGLTPYIKRGVCVKGQCGKDCPDYGKCRYFQSRRAADRDGIDFQVVNHNFFLADLKRRSDGKYPLIPDYQCVVIDESHKFLEAARDMYGSEFSLGELNRVVEDIRGFTFEPGQRSAGIIRELNRIQSRSRLMLQFLNKEIPTEADDETERFPTKIRLRTEKLMNTLRNNVDTLSQLLSGRAVPEKSKRRYKDTLRTVSRISDSLSTFLSHNNLVCWLEKELCVFQGKFIEGEPASAPRCGVLRGIPKNLGGTLFDSLWSREIPIILTSGTLSAAESFEHIKRKLGLDRLPTGRVVETIKTSPFNYKENSLLYLSENTPFPDNGDPDYIAAVAAEIRRLIIASHGHAAALFTSYKAMDMVHERIAANPLPFPVFRTERGGMSAIEQFKQSGDGVLFATNLWEGFDVSGDALSLLVIVRLPFAVPDPVSDWERSLYDNFDDYKNSVIIPEMLVKLKQGCGRQIRSESDTGVVAIIDRRVSSRGAYRKPVLDALPRCQVTSNPDDISVFMIEKKPAAYFA